MAPKKYLKKTRLNKADTKSQSLKTTIPIELTRKYGMKVGTELYWEEAIIKNGSIIDNNGEKVKSTGIQQIILIRVDEP